MSENRTVTVSGQLRELSVGADQIVIIIHEAHWVGPLLECLNREVEFTIQAVEPKPVEHLKAELELRVGDIVMDSRFPEHGLQIVKAVRAVGRDSSSVILCAILIDTHAEETACPLKSIVLIPNSGLPVCHTLEEILKNDKEKNVTERGNAVII